MSRGTLGLLVSLALSAIACGQSGAGEAHPIDVELRPLALHPAHPERTTLGHLRYLAGFELTSPDDAFGGFSGLAVAEDGSWLVAISDRGHWLTAELEHAADGRLEGFGETRLGPVLDLDGQPVEGRYRTDAEELERLDGESWIVSFEGTHRLMRYPASGGAVPAPDGVPEPFPFPEGSAAAVDNGGMEAVAHLGDGRFLVLAEDLLTEDRHFMGWVGSAEGWESLTLDATLELRPTGATALATGEVLLTERSYSVLKGTRVRLSIVDHVQIEAGAVLRPRALAFFQSPVTVDNFEGVAARPGPAGSTLVYLVSDDNFNQAQRTLLLQFELTGTEASTR